MKNTGWNQAAAYSAGNKTLRCNRVRGTALRRNICNIESRTPLNLAICVLHKFAPGKLVQYCL